MIAEKVEIRLEKKQPYKRLAEITRAITTSLNFDHVLDLIVENAAHLVHAKVSLLLLRNQDSHLRVRASFGIDKNLVNDFAGAMHEDIVDDLRSLLNVSIGELVVSVPIIAKGLVAGLLVIVSEEPLDSEEHWQISALADQASIALANARIYEMELAEATRSRDEVLTALQASTARITRILESITDLFYSLDREWRFTEVNNQTELRFGRTRQELLGKVIWDLFPAARESSLYTNLHRAVEENKPIDFEYASAAIAGVWFEAHAYPSDSGLSVYLRDITARRNGEVTRRLLAAIVESSSDAIISKDLNGVVSSWNKGAERIFGYTAAEAIGQNISMLIPPERFDEEPRILEQIRAGHSVNHYETIRQRKNGELIDISLTVSPIRDEDGTIVGASKIARDITETKRGRTKILFQARLLSAVEQAVIATDLAGKVIYWNAFAEKLYGWSAEEALGGSVAELVPAKQTSEQSREINQQLKKGGSWSGEVPVKRKDGTEFIAMLVDSPIMNDKGELAGTVRVSVDITDAREAEEERKRLLEAERLARAEAEAANRLKDEFLATLSHELRNPLNVVIGYSEILRRGEGQYGDGFVTRAAEVIKRNALAQSQLVSDLLDLSRLQMGKLKINREPLSLPTIVNDAIETVKDEAATKNISLQFTGSAESLIVNGDPVRLGQIVWNLLNNAVKFTSPGGKIAISLSREGPNARLGIEDTGQGIALEFVPHVFEIFRQADASSSRKQGGLGIGLALVKQLAEMHGGSVTAESEGIGRGARFVVLLPLQENQTQPPTVKNGTTGILNNRFILVVDDSYETTEMLSKLLQMEGASVRTARSGFEALSIAEKCAFDLVISDISMPEMDGYQLLRGLRALPHMGGVPALALTGYGRHSDVDRAHYAGFDDHFTKPINIDELLDTVRKLTKGS